MAVADRAPEVADEPVRVTAWRAHLLTHAGYPPEEAFLLAERQDVDVHVALDLLEQGCDLDTALRILT
jgi:hypothetical protein